MLVLFDHGTPKGLIGALPGHTVYTAQAKGWDTLSNGALLKAAEDVGVDVLLTTDRRIRRPKTRLSGDFHPASREIKQERRPT